MWVLPVIVGPCIDSTQLIPCLNDRSYPFHLEKATQVGTSQKHRNFIPHLEFS